MKQPSKATPIAAAEQNGGQAFAWICFAGSGTVCKVAASLRRDWIGIELKQEYITEIAEPFIAEAETGVPAKERKGGQAGLFDGN